jgi:D-glycerate 3-kinase
VENWLADFMAAELLPDSFRLTFDEVCRPLGDRALDWRADFGRTAFIGLCGAQGSGKSTIAAATAAYLEANGLKTAVLSLDDFYLGREARNWLAGQIHRLLQVRGPPGTHDVALACAVLDSLRGDNETPLPRFDKAIDERAPRSQWPILQGRADVVMLEGWCVGARPEPGDRLRTPVNRLEREDDPTGAWRGYVNRQLGDGYQALFGRLDRLVLLQAPGFEVVRGWRTEQEAKLRSRTGRGMTDGEVGRFVQHYERLTRWILEEMPDRVDWRIPLRPDRSPIPQR